MSRTAVRFTCLAFLAVLLVFSLSGPAAAKSLYAIANINASPTPIKAFNINPDGTLTYQAQYSVPYYGGGAVGLALAVDASFETLFVTYEVSNTIQLLDARTMTDMGTATATGASNLAGIVYDQVKKRVYTVDRQTNHLYVYRWDAASRTLTLDAQKDLSGLGANGAWGLALDRNNNHLYVATMSLNIPYFRTGDFSPGGSATVDPAGSIDVAGVAISVAVDNKNRLVYSGAGWAGNYNLDQYNQTTQAKQSLPLGTGIGIMGLGVDDNTGLVYCTTGYDGDDLRVYNSALQLVQNAGPMGGDPTGLVVPTADAGVNPLNFAKKADHDPVAPGTNLTYTLSFDNLNNPSQVIHQVTVTDNLPAQTTFVSATGGGTYQAATHSVVWNIGDLAPGAPSQSKQLVVQVKSDTPANTKFINSGTISSADTAPTTKTVESEVKLPFLGFPLPGYTETTAPVSAVMDNSVLERTPIQFYVPGDIIKAFNGETGERQYGVQYMDPWGLYWPAYPNSTGTPFFPASGSGARPLNYINGAYLSYAGNAGYNYQVAAGTQVLATASGKLYKCVNDPVNGAGYDAYYNSYIDHQNGYYSWYLYAPLNQAIQDEITAQGYAQVTRGQVIGTVCAQEYVPARLHFEVRQNGFDHANVVDPYKQGLWGRVSGHIEGIYLLLDDSTGGSASLTGTDPSLASTLAQPPAPAPVEASPQVVAPPILKATPR